MNVKNVKITIAAASQVNPCHTWLSTQNIGLSLAAPTCPPCSLSGRDCGIPAVNTHYHTVVIRYGRVSHIITQLLAVMGSYHILSHCYWQSKTVITQL